MKKLHISAVCGIGLKRKNNEDNLCVNGLFLDDAAVEATKSLPFEYSVSAEAPLLLSVCDGMGGEAAGEAASAYAASRLAALSSSSSADDILGSLRAVNSELVAMARERGAVRIGCTTAILSFSGESATAINIGDSRVYRLRRKKLEQLSHDHSEVQNYIDAGILSEEKAREHPRRHLITRFLGMPDGDLEFDPPAVSDVRPDDLFLICSDGLTECVDNRTLLELLCSEPSARRLYDEAMKRGGVDNTTIIVIRVD